MSARNSFSGTIKKLVRAPVSAEVTIRLNGGIEIVSVITSQSAQRLKLK